MSNKMGNACVVVALLALLLRDQAAGSGVRVSAGISFESEVARAAFASPLAAGRYEKWREIAVRSTLWVDGHQLAMLSDRGEEAVVIQPGVDSEEVCIRPLDPLRRAVVGSIELRILEFVGRKLTDPAASKELMRATRHRHQCPSAVQTDDDGYMLLLLRSQDQARPSLRVTPLMVLEQQLRAIKARVEQAQVAGTTLFNIAVTAQRMDPALRHMVRRAAVAAGISQTNFVTRAATPLVTATTTSTSSTYLTVDVRDETLELTLIRSLAPDKRLSRTPVVSASLGLDAQRQWQAVHINESAVGSEAGSRAFWEAHARALTSAIEDVLRDGADWEPAPDAIAVLDNGTDHELVLPMVHLITSIVAGAVISYAPPPQQAAAALAAENLGRVLRAERLGPDDDGVIYCFQRPIHPVFIETEGGRLMPIISFSDIVPVSRQFRFHTARANQRRAVFRVFSGPRFTPDEKDLVGTLVVNRLPAADRLQFVLRVDYSAEYNLAVTVTELATSRRHQLEVQLSTAVEAESGMDPRWRDTHFPMHVLHLQTYMSFVQEFVVGYSASGDEERDAA
ncbi:hypothetical protein P43SY_005481 [Pythium insidiosum]|uniref:Uncharacterized protein n=1 Tax=Pythium insidiosum TaxID=114742 RepID=A0AAD5Q622_PYTIN|nr:hypothetical protein P43SY_005481 [Pythium insidiosum]